MASDRKNVAGVWLWPLASIIALMAIGAALPALAQYAGYTPGYGYVSHPGSQFMPRLANFVVEAVLGALVGAFFSPALRRFRKYVWIGLGVAAGALGLFDTKFLEHVVRGWRPNHFIDRLRKTLHS